MSDSSSTKYTKVLQLWCEPADQCSLSLLNDQLCKGRQYAWGLDWIENDARCEFRNKLLTYTNYLEQDNKIKDLYSDINRRENNYESWKSDVDKAKAIKSEIYKTIKGTSDFKIFNDLIDEKKGEKCRQWRKFIGPNGKYGGLGYSTYQFEDNAARASHGKRKPWLMVKRDREPGIGTVATHLQNKYVDTLENIFNGKSDWVKFCPGKYSLKTLRQTRLDKHGSRRRPSSGRSIEYAPRQGFIPRERREDPSGRLSEVKIRAIDGKYITLHVMAPYDSERLLKYLDWEVRWVNIVVTKTGYKTDFSLQITISNETSIVKIEPVIIDKPRTAAVDLGWRLKDDGFKVAVVRTHDSAISDLTVTNDIVGRSLWSKCELDHKSESQRLRSTRDMMMNNVRDHLLSLKDGAPEWFAQSITYVDKWKSIDRYVDLARYWSNNRFINDSDTFKLLNEFIKQDRHLHNWEAHTRRRMTRQIRGLYQHWADNLAKTHDIIKIENLRLADFYQQLRERAQQDYDSGKMRSNKILIDRRNMLAIGEIIIALKRACNRTGCQLAEVEKADSSKICSYCGHKNKSSKDEIVTCAKCGRTENRDHRAVLNLSSRPVLKYIAGPLAETKVAKPLKNRRPKNKINDNMITDENAARIDHDSLLN
jgi:hypothetical protein